MTDTTSTMEYLVKEYIDRPLRKSFPHIDRVEVVRNALDDTFQIRVTTRDMSKRVWDKIYAYQLPTVASYYNSSEWHFNFMNAQQSLRSMIQADLNAAGAKNNILEYKTVEDLRKIMLGEKGVSPDWKVLRKPKPPPTRWDHIFEEIEEEIEDDE